jgi:hypothetical protein
MFIQNCVLIAVSAVQVTGSMQHAALCGDVVRMWWKCVVRIISGCNISSMEMIRIIPKIIPKF